MKVFVGNAGWTSAQLIRSRDREVALAPHGLAYGRGQTDVHRPSRAHPAPRLVAAQLLVPNYGTSKSRLQTTDGHGGGGERERYCYTTQTTHWANKISIAPLSYAVSLILFRGLDQACPRLRAGCVGRNRARVPSGANLEVETHQPAQARVSVTTELWYP